MILVYVTEEVKKRREREKNRAYVPL